MMQKKALCCLLWMDEHITVDRSRSYVIENCTPTGYVYFCCGCWQFLKRFWGKFDEFVGISKHRLPRAPNTHTSWLQLPFPSKFNYAITFLSDFCFRWEVLNLEATSFIEPFTTVETQSQISPIWWHAEEGERCVHINKKWSKVLEFDQRKQKWYLYLSLYRSFASYPTAVNTFADPQEMQSCILTSYCLLHCIKERQK